MTVSDSTRVQEVGEALEQIGCSTEWDKKQRLMAVSVPGYPELKVVQAYLSAEAKRGQLDYDEPIIRR